MKVVLAISALMACVLAEDWTPKTKEQREQIAFECLKEHPLSSEQMVKLQNHEFTYEEPIRNIILCKAVKNGFFNTDKGFYAKRIVAQYNPGYSVEEAAQLVNSCIDKHHKDKKKDNEFVYEVYFCLLKLVGDFRKNRQ